MAKTLVAYFSASGTTERVARELAAAIGADLFEIAPQVPYTRADLNWNNKSSRSSVEMNDESSRPAIASTVSNMDAYDTVFVGFPIWWYVEPRIVDTFLEAHDLTGKTIVPFATSGGSGVGGSTAHIASLVPQAQVKEHERNLEKLQKQQKALQQEVLKSLTRESDYDSATLQTLLADVKEQMEEAENALLEFSERWRRQYPSCVKSWEDNWDVLSTFFEYPTEIRKIIYTTNIIEGLNRQFRQITKNKPSFTNDDSLRRMLYLASQRIMKHWHARCQNWDLVLSQLELMFADRTVV